MQCIFVVSERLVVKQKYEHNPTPNVGDIVARRLKADMRKTAREESGPIQVIYQHEKVKLLQPKTTAPEVAANLPQFSGINHIL